MTAIAGLVDDGRVYIGGDSASGAIFQTVTTNQKVFVTRGVAFGFTSSWRMGQLIEHRFTPPVPDPEMDVMRYMVGPFVDALRAALKAGGFAKKENEVEQGGHFLVGTRGRLFHIHGDYSVLEAADGYDGVGCGEDMIRGSLYTSGVGAPQPPEDRIVRALEAAERWSGGVARPFTIVRSDV